MWVTRRHPSSPHVRCLLMLTNWVLRQGLLETRRDRLQLFISRLVCLSQTLYSNFWHKEPEGLREALGRRMSRTHLWPYTALSLCSDHINGSTHLPCGRSFLLDEAMIHGSDSGAPIHQWSTYLWRRSATQSIATVIQTDINRTCSRSNQYTSASIGVYEEYLGVPVICTRFGFLDNRVDD